jgi:hypothetical protein
VPSKSPAQAKLMRAVSHGWQPPGKHIDVGVAKEFMHADQRKKAHKSREGRADRKRELDKWAHGQRNTYAAPET